MTLSPTNERPVLVTGASGFVGNYLMSALAEVNIPASSIACLSLTAALPDRPERQIQLDICDHEAVSRVINELNPSAVIHLAAVAEPAKARANMDIAWQVNFEGTRNLAQAVLTHAPDARFIFAGSSESYGASFNQFTGAIPETAALRPMSAYGATKAAADIMLGQMAHEGLDVVRFRAFNHTGPGQTAAYVVPAFAHQIARIERGEQDPVVSVGNLDAKRDFVDVRDVVCAYCAALNATIRSPDETVFNISSGQARSIQSVLDALLALSQAAIEVTVDPARLRPSDVPYAAGDNSAIKRDLAWAPSIPFQQTLTDTLNYFRAHDKG